MTQIATRILLIEDSMDDAVLTRAYLRDSLSQGFDLTHVKRLSEAVTKLEASAFNVVLLDLNLPDSEKLDTVACVLEVGPAIPVLVLSGYDDEATAIEAVRAGAQDYILKDDLNARVLRRAINHAIERKRVELELERLAMYDELTGLPNRTLLLDRWPQARARSRRNQSQTGILMIALDGLKRINDNYGHQAGDHCLKVSAGRMSESVRGNDTVARLDGDEFVVLLEDVGSLKDVQVVADKIGEALARPIGLERQSLLLGASIGKSVSKLSDDEELESAVDRADSEMYSFKCAHKSPRDPGITLPS